MAGKCSICGHPKRKAINAAIAEGMPFRTMQARYGVSSGAISRHKANCLGQALAAANVAIQKTEQAAVEVVSLLGEVGGTIGEIRGMVAKLLAVLVAVSEGDTAAKAKVADLPASWKDPKTLAALLNSMRGFLELKGKVTGEIQTGPQVLMVFQSQEAAAYSDLLEAHAGDVLAEYLPAPVVAAAKADLHGRLEAQRQAAVEAAPRQGRGMPLLPG